MQSKAATPVRQGRAGRRQEGAAGWLQAGAGCVTPSRLVSAAAVGHSPREGTASGPR